eukprot:1045296-Amphidinium_carterae.1
MGVSKVKKHWRPPELLGEMVAAAPLPGSCCSGEPCGVHGPARDHQGWLVKCTTCGGYACSKCRCF